MEHAHDTHEYVDQPGGDRLRLRFGGTFEGHTLTWDAEFVTLARCYREWLARHHRPPGSSARLRPFIEIGPETPRGRALRVGLPVDAIDHATALKAMVMIRNYRKLQSGRYEYGEILTYP